MKFLASLSILPFFMTACSNAPGPQATPSLSPIEQEGLRLFILNCATCHANVPDSVIVGPSLSGVASRAGQRVEGMDARTYLQTSILNPAAFIVAGFPDSMPKDLGKQLTGEEFDAILAYLLTLK
jgi:nitric oxide reductase subunit C